MEKISVIIPAYNVEEYLERTLDSVLTQTYQNIEVIIIDDGSTDKTGVIADRVAKEDNRIKVIHQKNQGLSGARNTGLCHITGKYVTNIDADDYVRNDMLEIMMDDMSSTGADIVICGHEEGPEEEFNKTIKEEKKQLLYKYTNREKFKLLFNEYKAEGIVFWGKLYRRSVLTGIVFPVGKIHEDEYIVHYVLDHAGIVVYDSRILYHYYKRIGSITTDSFSLKRLDCIPALSDRIEFFERINDEELLTYAYKDFLRRFQYYYYGVKYHYPEKKELYSNLFEEYRSVYNKSKKYLSPLCRLRYGLFLWFPMLNYEVKKILGAKTIDK